MTARDDLYSKMATGVGRIDTASRARRLVEAFEAEVRQPLDAALARVRALHARHRDIEAVGDNDSCTHCNQLAGHRVSWPCPTIQGLERP